MILKVGRLGHTSLRVKSKPVAPNELKSDRFQCFLDDLVDTMRDYEGVGIAAPQVQVPKRVFAVECVSNPRYGRRDRIPLYFVINPKLEVLDRTRVGLFEGCLSVPEMRGWVWRHRKVRVTGWNREGKPVTVTASGFHARILQHEYDHLQGKVYLDRMKNLRTLSYGEHLG